MSISHAIYPSLRDKTVLITGGAEGIGAACVELFCRQGSNVVFFDISETSAKTLIEQIGSLKPSHPGFPITVPKFLHCDVTNLDELKRQADAVLQTYGTVDVLVNNAASTGAKSRVPSEEVTPSSWDFDVAVNLRHMFFLTQYVVPAMRAQKSGSIINMGSISWRIPATGLPVYVTCKAAVVGMTRTQSKEYGADNVRVNSVMPGAIATERQIKEVLTPEYREMVMAGQSLQRDLWPMEVAKVIVFLASEEASAVTGSSYVVDGGWVSDP